MPVEQFPIRAGGTIIPARFVKWDTANDSQVVQAAANTDVIAGIATDAVKFAPGLTGSDNTIAAQVNDAIKVFRNTDLCLLETGGAVTRGDLLKSDSVGRGVTATATGTDEVGARAMQSSTGAGIKIYVECLCRKF